MVNTGQIKVIWIKVILSCRRQANTLTNADLCKIIPLQNIRKNASEFKWKSKWLFHENAFENVVWKMMAARHIWLDKFQTPSIQRTVIYFVVWGKGHWKAEQHISVGMRFVNLYIKICRSYMKGKKYSALVDIMPQSRWRIFAADYIYMYVFHKSSYLLAICFCYRTGSRISY